jgi:hypothetical protein
MTGRVATSQNLRRGRWVAVTTQSRIRERKWPHRINGEGGVVALQSLTAWWGRGPTLDSRPVGVRYYLPIPVSLSNRVHAYWGRGGEYRHWPMPGRYRRVTVRFVHSNITQFRSRIQRDLKVLTSYQGTWEACWIKRYYQFLLIVLF